LDKTLSQRWYFWLAAISAALAFIVVILGAYTRLKGAGLGCPDWPGCYSHIGVPSTAAQLSQVAQSFPGQVVEPSKAWIEMVHRYFAGGLGLLTFVISFWGLFQYRKLKLPIILPLALIAMIIFQAALGRWTVTLKLMPIIVMGHLLGGFTVLSLLTLTALMAKRCWHSVLTYPKVKNLVWIALILLIVQIALGGWTSTNYAALVCPGLPMCHGNIMPAWDVHHAFQLWVPFDQLSYATKMTIQMFHRIGAVIVLVYFYALMGWMLARFPKGSPARRLAGLVLALVTLQIILGLLNIILILPLSIAVAHNGVAALLLLSVIALLYSLGRKHP
jgi:cytochrome c oxidase assembly protein subunit 15